MYKILRSGLVFLTLLNLAYGGNVSSGDSNSKDVNVTCRFSPKSISVGGRSTLIITVEGEVKGNAKLELQQIKGLKISYAGESTSANFVNGKYSKSISYSFNVTAEGKGTYVLPEMDLILSGITYKVPSASLVVKDSVSNNSVSQNQSSAFFLDLEYKRPLRWFVGQAIPAKLKACFSRSVEWGFPQGAFPQVSSDTFIVGNLPSDHSQKSHYIGQNKFDTVEWDVLLTPVKAGFHNLEFNLDCVVSEQAQRDLFDETDPFKSLFDNFIGRRQRLITLKTNLPKINSTSLPEPQAQHFTGGIGRFTITEPVFKEKEAICNEPLSLSFSVSGSGNFERLEEPFLEVDSEEWRVYNPKSEFDATDKLGYRGKVTYNYVIVPLKAGKLSAPKVSFCFFEPTKAQYITLKSSDMAPIEVKPPLPKFEKELSLKRNAERSYNVDTFKTIKLKLGKVYSSNLPIFCKRWFWILQMLILCVLSAALIIFYKNQKKLKDPAYAKLLKSKRDLKILLKKAASFESSDKGKFFENAYQSVQVAVQLSKNFDLDTMVLSLEDLVERKKLSDDSVKVLEKIFDYNDRAKFAGGNLDNEQGNVSFKELKTLIHEIMA